jgi:hypothetical protein
LQKNPHARDYIFQLLPRPGKNQANPLADQSLLSIRSIENPADSNCPGTEIGFERPA